MSNAKVLIPVYEDRVAPRFDLAAEVKVVTVGAGGKMAGEKLLILPQPSAEQLCHLVLSESVNVVICGGIEEEHFDYLIWKKVTVIDDVIGPVRWAIEAFARGQLARGQICREPIPKDEDGKQGATRGQ